MMEIDEIGQTSDDINDKKVAKEQHEQEKTIKLHPVRASFDYISIHVTTKTHLSYLSNMLILVSNNQHKRPPYTCKIRR